MAVRTEDLIRQTFDMLAKESTIPKALFVSRARLLALALQRYGRDLKQAREQAKSRRESMKYAIEATDTIDITDVRVSARMRLPCSQKRR